MKLGVLLTTSPEHEDARTVRRISEAALRQGHQANIFLMDDGVFCLNSLRDLVEKGAHLTVCAHNAYERGTPKIEGVLFGGQNDWAEIVNSSERVLIFG